MNHHYNVIKAHVCGTLQATSPLVDDSKRKRMRKGVCQ